MELTEKTKSLMGIAAKAFSEKEATIAELHSVGEVFFKAARQNAFISDAEIAMLTRRSCQFLKADLKEIYKTDQLFEDSEAAYEALYAFDTDYIIVFRNN